MRTLLAIVLLAAADITLAQDWALLNPAYRYNYGNDGTDTISNQVRVMDVDTLGPDSFRYELNRIGVVCDTCTELGQGEDWYMSVDQPGPFGQSVLRVPDGTWIMEFSDGQRSLRPEAALGDNWMFDTINAIDATITAIGLGNVLGESDSLKTVQFSTGDSMVFSRNHGIVSFPNANGATERTIIGIEGLQLGRLMPTVGEMFGLDVGDVVQYKMDSSYFNMGPGLFYRGRRIKYEITSRQVFNDSVVLGHTYAGQLIVSFPGQLDVITPFTGAGSWVLPDDSFMFPELALAYPGQVVRSVNWPWNLPFQSDTNYLAIARYEIDTGGYVVMRAGRFADQDQPIGPLTYAQLSFTSQAHVEFRPPVGLYSYYQGVVPNWNSMSWLHRRIEVQGSVIGGDTVGTVFSDSQMLGMQDVQAPGIIGLFPNPAADELVIEISSKERLTWQISDALGRELTNGRSNGTTRMIIPVAALAPGSYIFCLITAQGTSAKHFIIAR